jgi:hypothetical protein
MSSGQSSPQLEDKDNLHLDRLTTIESQITDTGGSIDPGNCDEDPPTVSHWENQKAESLTSSRAEPKLLILCDCAFIPVSLGRPRTERIRAVAKQLVNFLWWQQERGQLPAAHLQVVCCPCPTIRQELQARIQQLWTTLTSPANAAPVSSASCDFPPPPAFPTHLTFGNFENETIETGSNFRFDLFSGGVDPFSPWASDGNGLRSIGGQDGAANGDDGAKEQCCEGTSKQVSDPDKVCNSNVIYLSPDADDELDPFCPPPPVVVVGLLIDRKVQANRSLQRATEKLRVRSARWPLSSLQKERSCWCGGQNNRSDHVAGSSRTSSHAHGVEEYRGTLIKDLHQSEPFNVDTILEALQLWHWNYYCNNNSKNTIRETMECERPPSCPCADADVNDKRQWALRSCEAATIAALRHHVERHPNRPFHLPTGHSQILEGPLSQLSLE